MRFRSLLCLFFFALILLTSCSDSPDSSEDVRSFSQLLVFLTESGDAEVSDVILNVESAISDAVPVTLPETERTRCISMLSDVPLTLERYEPEHIYGGSWYTVTFVLTGGESAVLYPAQDRLMVFRQELNEEERWYSASYRVNSDASDAFYTMIGELWTQFSDQDPATY